MEFEEIKERMRQDCHDPKFVDFFFKESELMIGLVAAFDDSPENLASSLVFTSVEVEVVFLALEVISSELPKKKEKALKLLAEMKKREAEIKQMFRVKPTAKKPLSEAEEKKKNELLGKMFGFPPVEPVVATKEKRCSVFITYKDICDLKYSSKKGHFVETDKFPPGEYSHNDVEVVVIKLNEFDFSVKNPKMSYRDLVAQNSFLTEKNITDIYVYVGKLSWNQYDINEDKVNLMNVMISLALYYKKSKTVIHIVGCDCDYKRKRIMAEQNGFDFISCQCGGYDDMARIIKLLLKKQIGIVFCEKCRRYQKVKDVSLRRTWIEEKEGKKFKFFEFKCRCSDDKRTFSVEID